MPCTTTEHDHTWTTTGDLVIQGCETFCAFCPSTAATKNWRYAWFLARHVRTFHKYEYPMLGKVTTTKKARRTKAKLRAIKLEAEDESPRLAAQMIGYKGQFSRVNEWLDATAYGSGSGIGKGVDGSLGSNMGVGSFGGSENGVMLEMDGYGHSNGSGGGNGSGNEDVMPFAMNAFSNDISMAHGLPHGLNTLGDGIGGKIEYDHNGVTTALQYQDFNDGLYADLYGGTNIYGQDFLAGMCGPLTAGTTNMEALGRTAPLMSKDQDNLTPATFLDPLTFGNATFVMAVEPANQETATELLAKFQNSGQLAQACHQMRPAEILSVVRQYAEQLNLQISF